MKKRGLPKLKERRLSNLGFYLIVKIETEARKKSACKDKVWMNKERTWICWVFWSSERDTVLKLDLHVIWTYLFMNFYNFQKFLIYGNISLIWRVSRSIYSNLSPYMVGYWLGFAWYYYYYFLENYVFWSLWIGC